jgi:hypothetical protein
MAFLILVTAGATTPAGACGLYPSSNFPAYGTALEITTVVPNLAPFVITAVAVVTASFTSADVFSKSVDRSGVSIDATQFARKVPLSTGELLLISRYAANETFLTRASDVFCMFTIARFMSALNVMEMKLLSAAS